MSRPLHRVSLPASSPSLALIEQQQADIEFEIAQLNQQLSSLPQKKSPSASSAPVRSFSPSRSLSRSPVRSVRFSPPQSTKSAQPTPAQLNPDSIPAFYDSDGRIDLDAVYRSRGLSTHRSSGRSVARPPASATHKAVKMGDLSQLTNIDGVSQPIQSNAVQSASHSVSSQLSKSASQKALRSTSPSSLTRLTGNAKDAAFAANADKIMNRTASKSSAPASSVLSGYQPPAFAHVQEAQLVKDQLAFLKAKREEEWKKKLEDRRNQRLKQLQEEIQTLDRSTAEWRAAQEKRIEQELEAMRNSQELPVNSPAAASGSQAPRSRSVTFHSPERSHPPVVVRHDRVSSAELIEAELRKINQSLVNMNVIEAEQLADTQNAATQRPRSLVHSDSSSSIPLPPQTPGFSVHYVSSPAPTPPVSRPSTAPAPKITIRGREKTPRVVHTPSVGRHSAMESSFTPTHIPIVPISESSPSSAEVITLQHNDPLVSSVSHSLAIRSKSPHSARLRAHRSAMQRISTMLAKGKAKQEKLQVATAANTAEVLKECTFNPALSPQTKEITRAQAEKKLKRLLEQQELLRMRQEELLGQAFQPVGTKGKPKSPQAKSPKSLLLQDRIDALYQSHADTQSKLAQKRRQKQLEDEEKFHRSHPFQPNIEQIFHSKALSMNQTGKSGKREKSSSYAHMFESESTDEAMSESKDSMTEEPQQIKKSPARTRDRSRSRSRNRSPPPPAVHDASDDFIATQQAELERIQRALHEIQILHPFTDENRAILADELKKSTAQQWNFESAQQQVETIQGQEKEQEYKSNHPSAEASQAAPQPAPQTPQQAPAVAAPTPPGPGYPPFFPPYPYYPPPQYWPGAPFYPPPPFPMMHPTGSPGAPAGVPPPPFYPPFPPYFPPSFSPANMPPNPAFNPAPVPAAAAEQPSAVSPDTGAIPSASLDDSVLDESRSQLDDSRAEALQEDEAPLPERNNSLKSFIDGPATDRSASSAVSVPSSVPASAAVHSDTISIPVPAAEYSNLDSAPAPAKSEAEIMEERRRKLAKLKARSFQKQQPRKMNATEEELNDSRNEATRAEEPEHPEEKAPVAAPVPAEPADRLLVHVDIQLSATQSARISVRSRDDPAELAHQFVRDHSLKPEFQPIIERLLIQQIQAVQNTR